MMQSGLLKIKFKSLNWCKLKPVEGKYSLIYLQNYDEVSDQGESNKLHFMNVFYLEDSENLNSISNINKQK